MNEQEVRKIVKEEMQRNYRSGSPLVPPHTHDGVNNTRIDRSNIINSGGIMGNINFTANDTYTLYFSNPNPSRLDFNGFAFDTGANDSSALVVGVAILAEAYYFQPLTDRSVKQGGIQYPINGVLAQCSSNLFVQDAVGTANTFPHVSQFYIMNAISSSGNYLATGQVQNLTNNSVDIVITNLLSGWNVSANFIIT